MSCASCAKEKSGQSLINTQYPVNSAFLRRTGKTPTLLWGKDYIFFLSDKLIFLQA
jgi:hypothetical protein